MRVLRLACYLHDFVTSSVIAKKLPLLYKAGSCHQVEGSVLKTQWVDVFFVDSLYFNFVSINGPWHVLIFRKAHYIDINLELFFYSKFEIGCKGEKCKRNNIF